MKRRYVGMHGTTLIKVRDRYDGPVFFEGTSSADACIAKALAEYTGSAQDHQGEARNAVVHAHSA